MTKRTNEYSEIKHGDYFTKEEFDELTLPTPPAYIDQMNIEYMWNNGFTGKDIKVAVIDTGCDVENHLLKDKIIHVCNLSNDDEEDRDNVTDYLGHGTHVASLIAGDKYLDGRFMGVAPDVQLMIYKVVDKNGVADYDIIGQAIYAACQRGADIINISLGGNAEAPQIHEAIKMANRMQVPVVGASGNSGDGSDETTEILFPSCYEEVIQVGSINDKLEISSFSNTNQFVDCVAMGEEVIGCSFNDGFRVLSGTSQSVPLVVGALALLMEWSKKEYGRRLSEVEIYSLLIKNTKSIENVSRNAQGHGYICLNPHISKGNISSNPLIDEN